MKRLCIISIFLVSILAVTVSATSAVNYSFEALEFPGALRTYAMDINDSGAITGYYQRSLDGEYDYRFYLGFHLRGSAWTTLDLSINGNSTHAYGVNNHDWIVGSQEHPDEYGFTWGFGHVGDYICPGYGGHTMRFHDVNDAGIIIGSCGTNFWGGYITGGFIFDGTSYLMLTAPDGSHPIPIDINNQGIAIATFENSSYYINGDIWHTLSYPGATKTNATAINNLGTIVGNYTDSVGRIHGFILNGIIWKSGNYPGAIETIAYDINDKGLIVGSYKDAEGKSHGFSYINGAWSRLDYPGATDTFARLVNNSGLIVGSFTKDGLEGEFLATPITTVVIDIRPWNIFNQIYYKDPGTLQVAILSNRTFKAYDVLDLNSLTFGRTGDEASLTSCSSRHYDVNFDGYADLICTFTLPEAAFQCGDSAGILKGKKKDGLPIEGKSYVRMIGCR